MRVLFRGTMCVAALALAACTAQDVESGGSVRASADDQRSASAWPVPGGTVREGGSIATMADQYAPPRPGPYAATGASAWVPAAPAPAFVASGPMPPADPPVPPPAAVANRQPAPPAPAASASELVRPEAAQPESAAAARDPAVRTAGLALFNNFTCGACHAFADAGSGGGVGPSLDRQLAVRTVVDAVSQGRGPMPSYAGQMSDEEILALANYIHQFSR